MPPRRPSSEHAGGPGGSTRPRSLSARRSARCDHAKAPATVRLPVTTTADRRLLTHAVGFLITGILGVPYRPSAGRLVQLERIRKDLEHGATTIAVPVELAEDLRACLALLITPDPEAPVERPDVGMSIALMVPAAAWGLLAYVALALLH